MNNLNPAQLDEMAELLGACPMPLSEKEHPPPSWTRWLNFLGSR